MSQKIISERQLVNYVKYFQTLVMYVLKLKVISILMEKNLRKA